MHPIHKYVSIALLTLILTVLMSASAQAHLMGAQHGTLNFVDDGAFMVLSLPISAFDGIDDDDNGKISMIEFNNHRAAIVESVTQNIRLSDKQRNLSLEGIILSPVVPHDASDKSISQLTVMGRFVLVDSNSTLRFQVELFGKQPSERQLKITATRKSDKQAQVFELTPVISEEMLFTDTAYSNGPVTTES
jgi:hypothetical protein